MKTFLQILFSLIVIIVSLAGVFFAGRDYGQTEMKLAMSKVPKVCAIVPGEQVVSSTADTCTYASSYGRATRTRRAM